MAHIKDILGYKKEVEKLKSVCDFLKNTEKYIDFGVELPHCLLICGERGVGKTLMMEALAEDCEREIFNTHHRDLSINRIRKVFKIAREAEPSIVLIDDINYLDKDNDKDLDIYWQLVDEINSYKNGEVFVVITVNDRENLPDYLMDQLDSDMIIELQPPKIEEACEIFKPIFDENKLSKDFNINDFCCFARDMTYLYANDTFNNAARLAIYEGQKRVSMQHLIKAGLLLKGYELAVEFDPVTAYHEAGHAAVNLLLGGDAAFIVLLDSGGGYFKEKDLKTKTYYDKERRYIVSVAGKACEEIFTGTSSIGSYSDLSRVSVAIEDDVKILASQGFEYFDSTELNSPAYNDSLAKKVQADLQKYYDTAKELIIKNKLLIETFVDKLKDKFYLLHSEIYNIYNDYIARKI